MQLSKSEYMMYLKHPAWVWYKKHDKTKLPEVDAGTQAIFDAGALFETYAEQRFEDAKKLGFGNYQEYCDLPERTHDALQNGATTLLQGRFVGDHITCICDAVVRVDENTVDVYEIKSSTKVKDEHIHDLGFQLVVLEQAGWCVRRISLIHVDTTYTRYGDIDPYGLSTVVDVTSRVTAYRETTKHTIDDAWETIRRREPPDISPRYASAAGFSDWMEVFKQLKGGIPESSIYDLFLADSATIGKLEDAGVTTLADIPEHIQLSKKQRWQVTAAKTDRQHIDPEPISRFLSGFEYPLHFLDYETAGGIVPPFEGLRPFQQLPFQYSLHILRAPEAEPEHYEYLHTENSDPTEAVFEHLRSHIETTGTVLVWNERFEKQCNELMGAMHPESATFMEDINARIQDLMIPFSGGWFVDQRFGGSASIKRVLPVLAPELSYGDLDIQDGGSAQRAWMEAVIDNPHAEPDARLFEQLRHYCRLDTLAMVRIFQRLYEIQTSSGTPPDDRNHEDQLRFL